jgi:hypothetical protein
MIAELQKLDLRRSVYEIGDVVNVLEDWRNNTR